MSVSNIFRNRILQLAVMASACLSPAAALDPNHALDQYLHTQWGREQGFPGGAVNAFAQTPDGYLWIAAEKGLVRFDGISFRLFHHANTASLPAGPVLSLAVDSEGSLWVRPQSPGLLRYRNGIFQDAFPNEHEDMIVTAMAPGRGGDVLLVSRRDPMRFRDGKLTHFAPSSGQVPGLAISVAETSDGTFWMGTRDEGLISLHGTAAWVSSGLKDRRVDCLLSVEGSQLWIGTDDGLVRWNGSELTQRGIPSSLAHTEVFALTRDRDSNLWAGTAVGLMRLDGQGVASGEVTQRSAAVQAVFEDREGNLWVGTSRGIERYRDSAFVNYVSASDDPLTGKTGPLYVDSARRTWYGLSTGGLHWFTDTRRGSVTEAGIGKDIVYSIAGGDGTIWIGRQRGGLTELREQNGALITRTYTAANGLARGSIYTVHRTNDGTIWAGGVSGGVSRVRYRQIKTYTTADGLLSNSISAIEETPDGVVWFATSNGLQTFAQDKWTAFTSEHGVPPGRVNCLTADSQGVLWIGTDAGLAFIRAGRLQLPNQPPDPLLEPVFGIAARGPDDLWIATASHVVEVPRNQLLGDRAGEGVVREFGAADGLDAAEGVRRSRSAVADPAGRIWFSLNGGISMVDPARVAINSVPALVHIQSVSVDGRTIATSAITRVGPGVRRITVGYAGISLAAPEQVRYRYRLDAFDSEWSEPTAARETIYTNLRPGMYRFHVVASNSQGVLNSAEAAIGLEVVPSIWQTSWFFPAIASACALGLLLLFRLRMHRVTAALNLRFHERLAERTRIAQELHDTLLQGLLSASMQVHVAADAVPADSPAKPTITRALELLKQVIDEGRNVVKGLRLSDNSAMDLVDAFSRVREELDAESTSSQPVAFRVIVDGEQRQLHPMLRDEVYRIGREALINAFRHSRARHIELELKYDSDEFRVFVRDDGAGIDPKVVEVGRDGHWGLSGMRERADRIGARLHVFSSAASGTEIELDVPGSLAFNLQQSRRKWKWLTNKRETQ